MYRPQFLRCHALSKRVKEASRFEKLGAAHRTTALLFSSQFNLVMPSYDQTKVYGDQICHGTF